MAVTFPTVHLGGTNVDDLIAVNREALDKVREASNALAKAVPNGRDFHVQGPAASSQALAEHYERVDALSGVIKSLMAIVANLMDQKEQREARKRK